MKKIRGGSRAVVPASAVVPYYNNQRTSLLGGALGSVWTLQKHLQRQRQQRTAWLRDSSNAPAPNGSTILCPKPYGMLGLNSTTPAHHQGASAASPLYGQIDTNLVLLLPSSSVPRPQLDVDEAENASLAWDGTWVEVDATITAIRQLPHYGSRGELAAGTAQTNAAVGPL